MHAGIGTVGSTINRGISIILFADPGKGKTTCAARLPVGETLFINVEAGIGPLLGSEHLSFEMKRNLNDLVGIYKYLKNEQHPFKYVVIDNISELQEWMVLSLTESRKKDFAELRERGDGASKMRENCYNFRNLIDNGINVIFNAWEMPLEIERNGETVRTKLYPKLTPKLSPEICGIVDMVGHLESYERTGDRYIRFEANDQIFAKSQYRGLEKFEPADLKAVFDKVRKFNYTKAPKIKPITKEEIVSISSK